MEEERAARREAFLQDNYLKWNSEGMAYRKRRLQHGMTLKRVGELLGTSGSRVARFEKGLPVTQAESLKKCYNLLFDHLELHATLLDLRDNHKWRG